MPARPRATTLAVEHRRTPPATTVADSLIVTTVRRRSAPVAGCPTTAPSTGASVPRNSWAYALLGVVLALLPGALAYCVILALLTYVM